MATAKLVDGVALVGYVNGVPVDSEGRKIEGAPKQPKDTDPAKQPGAAGAPTTEERIGLAIATALISASDTRNGATRSAPASAEPFDEDGEEPELPKIKELAAFLETLTTAKEVEDMQAGDERVGAQPLYLARLAELGA